MASLMVLINLLSICQALSPALLGERPPFSVMLLFLPFSLFLCLENLILTLLRSVSCNLSVFYFFSIRSIFHNDPSIGVFINNIACIYRKCVNCKGKDNAPLFFHIQPRIMRYCLFTVIGCGCQRLCEIICVFLPEQIKKPAPEGAGQNCDCIDGEGHPSLHLGRKLSK